MEKRTPTEAIYIHIGKNIAKLRKELNLTQQELAKRINSTRQTITLYETGSRRIPLVALSEISRVFQVELQQLIPQRDKNLPGPIPKIKLNFQKIMTLDEADQKMVIDLLNSLHKKNKKEN